MNAARTSCDWPFGIREALPEVREAGLHAPAESEVSVISRRLKVRTNCGTGSCRGHWPGSCYVQDGFETMDEDIRTVKENGTRRTRQVASRAFAVGAPDGRRVSCSENELLKVVSGAQSGVDLYAAIKRCPRTIARRELVVWED